MNFVMAGAEKKRFGVFIQTMRCSDEYAETFFKKPEALFSGDLYETVQAFQEV